jgi:hypothetical protein
LLNTRNIVARSSTPPVDRAVDHVHETPTPMWATCGESCGKATILRLDLGSDQPFLSADLVCRNMFIVEVEG